MSDALSLRPGRPADRFRLEELERRASLMWEEDRAALLAHPDAIVLPLEHLAAGRVVVAEHDGAAVGFSILLPPEDGRAELDGLFVEPDSWGSGVGRRLLQAAERQAASEGATTLHVTAHSRSVGFYAACGFEMIGEEPTQFGSAYGMGKRLGP